MVIGHSLFYSTDFISGRKAEGYGVQIVEYTPIRFAPLGDSNAKDTADATVFENVL